MKYLTCHFVLKNIFKKKIAFKKFKYSLNLKRKTEVIISSLSITNSRDCSYVIMIIIMIIIIMIITMLGTARILRKLLDS